MKKKYKSANFAAGCSRTVIERRAEMMGISMEELITKTILAMKSCEAGVLQAMEEYHGRESV